MNYTQRKKAIDKEFDTVMDGKEFTFQNEIELLKEAINHIETTLGIIVSPGEVARLYHRQADKQQGRDR